MKRTITYLFLVVSLCQSAAIAQEQTDTLRAKDNVMFRLPTVSVNFGINHLMGDVALNKPAASPISQFGYQLMITQPVAKFLNVSLALYTGSVRGEEMRDSVTNLNFRTTLFSQQLSVEYNFYPLLKPKDDGRQLIQPYVGFGVGMVSFRSKGDLKNASGIAYHYWSDGTVRAEVEGSIDPSESTILERDLVYETDLRDANLDGLKKYSQLAFTLPINAGVRFQVSKNVGVNAAFTYALNFTDMIDNVSSEGVGSRHGKKGFDNQLYGSIGLSVFLGRTKHSSKPKRFDDLIVDNPNSTEKDSVGSRSNTETTASETEKTSTEKDGLISTTSDAQDATAQTESAADRKLAQLSTKKKNIDQLKTSVSEQLTALETLKKSIMSNSKLKKSEIAKVKEQLQTAYSSIQNVDSIIPDWISVRKRKELQSPSDVEITSKENALYSITKLTKALSVSLAALRTEEKEMAMEESKLDTFTAIRAKVLSMEKMSTKDSAKTFMTDADRLKALDATLAELRTMEQDSSFNNIIDRSEIGALIERAERAKLPDDASRPTVARSGSEAGKKDVGINKLASDPTPSSKEGGIQLDKEVTLSVIEQPSAGKEGLASASSVTQNPPAPTESASDRNLAQVSAEKQNLNLLRTAVNDQLKALEVIKKELAGDAKFKKPQALKVKEQLQSARSNVENVNSSAGTAKEENTLSENVKKDMPLEMELASKADAVTAINKMTDELNGSLATLRTEEKELAKEESKLHTFHVVRAKVRLMEKMNAKSGVKSTMTEEERLKALDAVVAELKTIEQDTSFKEIIDRSEIEQLTQRADAIHLSLTNPNVELASADAENNKGVAGAALKDPNGTKSDTSKKDPTKVTATSGTGKNEPSSTKDATSTKPRPGADKKGDRTVEEIKNAPPKVPGGFHWADVNKNGMISPDEVLYFIDALFEGESEKTVEDIQNLIDYYFDQE